MSIDETKNHLRISQSPFLSHLPIFALQELYAVLLTHDAIRAVMFHAAQSHDHLDPDRISFTLSVQALRDVVILATQMSPCLLEQGCWILGKKKERGNKPEPFARMKG